MVMSSPARLIWSVCHRISGIRLRYKAIVDEEGCRVASLFFVELYPYKIVRLCGIAEKVLPELA